MYETNMSTPRNYSNTSGILLELIPNATKNTTLNTTHTYFRTLHCESHICARALKRVYHQLSIKLYYVTIRRHFNPQIRHSSIVKPSIRNLISLCKFRVLDQSLRYAIYQSFQHQSRELVRNILLYNRLERRGETFLV